MNNDNLYDAIVVGVGGMGSAALYHMARRGKRVLGLERYSIPNSMGSSHGLTRIIRLAYFEHPTYVPLLRRAYELWRELQNECGEQLLYVTGSVDAGRPGTPVFEGSVASCEAHQLDHEILNSSELMSRYPGYRVPDDFRAVWQRDGGFLLSERCIVGHVTRAQSFGAVVHAHEKMRSWQVDADGEVYVVTDRGEYRAARLVITAGAWAAECVPALVGHAVPERQVLGWFQPLRPELFQVDTFPVFNVTADEGHFYGFPVFSVPGFKIGRYHHHEEHVDPDAMDREPHARDEQTLRDFVARYFPDANGPTMSLCVCMFTNTKDEHFLIDLHPDYPQVSIAAGFSGHGFKFCSIVGEIMADLAEHGETRHDIGRFSMDRLED